MTSLSALDRLRQPAYTGENRCTPCTVVNLLLGAIVTVAVGLYAPAAGLIVGGLSVVVIYLRGYLVPGTPELTKQYLPNRVLRWFDKHPTESETETETWETIERREELATNAVDPEQFLLEADVVEPCADSEDICFTDAFERRLRDRFDYHREHPPDTAAIASLFDRPVRDVSKKDRSYPAVTVDRRVHKWPGDAALLADVAANDALVAHAAGWMDVPTEQRLEILKMLRSFHNECPVCDSPVSIGSTTAESCCATYEVVAVSCPECAEHLLELDPEMVGSTDEHGIAA